MRFKLWFNLYEQYIINENYKTAEDKFIAQGNNPQIVQQYINNFQQIIKYKQIEDPIGGLEKVPPNIRKNIDAYQDFHQLETLVDYVKGQVDTQGKTNFKNLKIDAKPIYEDQNLEIYYADSPQACVTYRGSVPYGWCVARSDSSNMFNAYRYKEDEPAFYFVKNKAKTNAEFSAWNALKLAGKAITGGLQFQDKYHFFVIQVIMNANINDATQQQYIVTSALNDGDNAMSWQEITKIEPLLTNLQNIFEPKPLTTVERKFYAKYHNGISDEDFIKLPYHEKDMYINVFVNLNKRLTDEQFKVSPIDLKNKYIGFGVGLSENQLQMIDNKLKRRYEEVTIKKIEKMLDESLDIDLLPTEINILIAHKDKFDLNKLSDQHVRSLLYFAKNKNEMAKFIIQHMSKLSKDNYISLLLYADNKEEIKELLGQENINKLSDGSVYQLLAYADDKAEIARILGSENINKISDYTVYLLLQYADDKAEIARILGSGNFNKLSDDSVRDLIEKADNKDEMAKLIAQHKKELSDDNVRHLIEIADNKDEMAKLIIKNKSELSDENVYQLLHHAKDKEEIARILSPENINKLSDDNVYQLLHHAKDKEAMVRILGPENINKLSDDNVSMLLHYAKHLKQGEMFKLIIQYKTELSDDNVHSLLTYADNKEEIAELLGQENINKLSDNNVMDLLQYGNNKAEMAKIFNQYYNKKTPENQYL